MNKIRLRSLAFVILAGIAALLPAHALKFRIPPLQELVCKSDIVVVGALHVYLVSGIGVTTTASGYDENKKPVRYTIPARYYDQGQITSYTAETTRFIKDDPIRDASGGSVNVVLKSTGTYPPGMDLGTVIRDKERWLWLLHREEMLGQYYVLKQLPLSEEKSVATILKEGVCEKR